MKFAFSLQKKEVSVEADVEGLVEKGLERREKNPDRKTRYQIKQDEKRKNEELKHKQEMRYMLILIGMVVFFILVAIIASALGL